VAYDGVLGLVQVLTAAGFACYGEIVPEDVLLTFPPTNPVVLVRSAGGLSTPEEVMLDKQNVEVRIYASNMYAAKVAYSNVFAVLNATSRYLASGVQVYWSYKVSGPFFGFDEDLNIQYVTSYWSVGVK
jgi:hypothetical protein